MYVYLDCNDTATRFNVRYMKKKEENLVFWKGSRTEYINGGKKKTNDEHDDIECRKTIGTNAKDLTVSYIQIIKFFK